MRHTLLLAAALFVTSAHAATLTLEADLKQVPRYAKIEFAVNTDAPFANPYDPADIDLSIELTSPAKSKLTTPAFFIQPYEARPIQRGNRQISWIYPAGQPAFRARFAPAEPGEYRAVAVLRQKGSETRSAPVVFTCTPSKDRGYVRVSKKDPRYFEFDDGSPYFAIGQNVAFIKDLFHNAEMLRKMGAAGANFARVWCCCEDWGMAIESHKSAWARSWDKRDPFAKIEGDPSGRVYVRLAGDAGASITCNPADPVALKPGAQYRLSGRVKLLDGAGLTIGLARPITISGKQPDGQPFSESFTTTATQFFLQPIPFRLTARGTAYIDALALQEATANAPGTGSAPAVNLLTDADPNTPPLGVYHQMDAAILDQIVQTAEQAGVYLQLTALTRNLYMNQLSKVGSDDYARATQLARNVLRYFVARWGYSTHVLSWEYFNEMDPGKPADKFYSDLADYFDSIDPNRHPRATSDWHFPTRAFQHPRLDQADIHFYLRPPSGESWKDAVASVRERYSTGSAKLGSPRPLLLSEYGITDEKWQMNKAVIQDKDWLHWHDGNWTAMLSGFASTGCHWYWDEIHKRDAYSSIYPPLVRFAADIPWTTAGFKPAAATTDASLRVLGLAGSDRAYLHLSDPASSWYAIVIDGKPARRIDGAVVKLELPTGKYQVEWWDTRKGEPVARQQVESNGTLLLKSPAFERSIACKITK